MVMRLASHSRASMCHGLSLAASGDLGSRKCEGFKGIELAPGGVVGSEQANSPSLRRFSMVKLDRGIFEQTEGN